MKKLGNHRTSYKTTLLFSLLTFVSACGQKGTVLKDQEKTKSSKKEKYYQAQLSNVNNQNGPATNTETTNNNTSTTLSTNNSEVYNNVAPTANKPLVRAVPVKTENAQAKRKDIINKHNFLRICSDEDLSYREEFQDRLPYEFARIDVFMQDSDLHQIGAPKEFMVVNVDGYIRLIGRVSTGAEHYSLTPARRWGIFGFERKKYQWEEGERESPMPWSIMLMKHSSTLKNCSYSKACFHGTWGYGHGSYGYQASHGCIRCPTIPDGNMDQWTAYGLHQELWKLINPLDLNNTDIVPDKGGNYYESWHPTSQSDRETLIEMNKKIKIYTHNASSLAAKPGLRSYLEEMYPLDLIKESIGNMKREVHTHFKKHEPSPRTKIHLRTLCEMYRLEDL